MIMNEYYNLIYWHIETGRQVLARKVMTGRYTVYDPETQKKTSMSRHTLIKTFRPDAANELVGRRKTKAERNVLQRFGSEFQTYLGKKTE